MNRTHPRLFAFAPSRLALALATTFAAQASHAAPPAPTTLPTGGQVVAGQASIQQAGSAMTIRQSTDQAILNWQSFSIGASASVNFVQPGAGSVALNRVLGSDPSAIYGSLSANGQVFLVNPSGVIFGPGARVDVGGLVASTLAIRDTDFLARNYRFTRDGATGAVVNQGELNGQYVALLAPEVRNEGVIAARMGTIALAAGEAVTLGISGQRLVDVQVDKASIDTLVENRQLVRADEGTVILSAQSAKTLLGRVVNSGAIEAKGLSTDGGTVRLFASSSVEHSGSIAVDGAANGSGGSAILLSDLSNTAGRTTVSGSISARGGSESGNGGFIETSGHRLSIADGTRIDASATNGRSGLWLLDPIDLTIAPNGDISGTTISASLNGGSDVTLQTDATSALCDAAACPGTASAGANGDIHVNQEISWTTAKTLTLSAWRDVNINSPITSTNAAGKLALEYNQGDGGGSYKVYAPVSLAAGNNFSTKDGSGGTPDTYAVLTAKADLVGIAGDLSGKYALGADIDASGADWVPLGTGDNAGTGFSGVLEGLRHAVTKVTTTTAANNYVGLFGTIDANGKVRNLGVETDAAGITGTQFVGVVAGKNYGTVSQTYSKGLITGAGVGTVLGIGGLVGWNEGSITETFSTVKVDAAGGTQAAGMGTDGGIGGLVGVNNSNVANSIYASYATGQVDGGIDVGGLVGFHQVGAIQATYATGTITGATNVGGLIGNSIMPFNVIDGYWNSENAGAGATAAIGNDLATAAAMKVGANFTGGGTYDFNTTGQWVIYETISRPLLRTFLTPLFAYADNKTRVYDGQAGFAGLTATLSIAAPDAGKVGGAATVSDAAITKDVGVNPVTPSGFTQSNAQKEDQHGYLISYLPGVATVTAKALTLDTSGVLNTKVYNGNTTPAGTAPALLADEAAGAGTTIDGKPYTGDVLTLSGAAAYDFKDVATATKVVYSGISLGGAAAGNYTLTLPADLAATITQKALNVNTAGVSNTKVADGNTTAAGAALFAAEAVGTGTTADGKPYTGDTVSLTGNGTFDSATAGQATKITFGGLGLTGAQSGNYSLTIPADIMPATITAPATTTTSTSTEPVMKASETTVTDTFQDQSRKDICAALGTANCDTRLAIPIALSTSIPPQVNFVQQPVPSNPLGGAPTYTRSQGNAYPTFVPAGAGSGVTGLTSIPDIGNFSVRSGQALSITLPDQTFTHSSPNALVTVEARLSNGQPLPSWLRFDPTTGTFTGQPPAGLNQQLSIEVIGRDNTGRQATTHLDLQVQAGQRPQGQSRPPGA